MGTNYYLEVEAGDECSYCGRTDKAEKLHIGKSSGGWCFALHVIPEEGINDLDDWKAKFPAGRIVDEYGRPLDSLEMLDTITKRSRDTLPLLFDYGANSAEPGPNNLARHKINGHCIKHGAGTWDCITGEFS